MGLDPLSALAVAQAVLDFVGFASKLVSKTYDFHASTDGILAENREQQTIATNLEKLTRGLDGSLQNFARSRKLSKNETWLRTVTIDCQKVASEMQDALTKLEPGIDGKASFLQSFRLALREYWGRHKIERLERSLNEATQHVMIHLLVVSLEGQNENFFSNRDGQTKMESNILEAIRKAHGDLQEQILALSKDLDKAKGTDRQAIVLNKWQARNHGSISSVVDTFTLRTEETQRKIIVQRYLDNLYFVQIKERRSQIPEAHMKTFKWVFDERPGVMPWRDFADWFSSKESGDSFYWITGKPGSGKSTLMRYIYDDPRTRTHLQRWSGSRELLVADCFFWNPGTKLQKSQSGLLRSLLYDLLKGCPELIPIVSPWRWRSYDLGATSVDEWSDAELRITLQELAKATADSGYTLCLFVDGLDEFAGCEERRTEINNLLKDLSQNQHIKVCVSSRPWLVFEDAFKHDPKLLLQDLTKEDIRLYIEDEFEQDQHYRHFSKVDPQSCSELQIELGKKSQGVFLWVFLVVHSLLRGSGIATTSACSSTALTRYQAI